MEFKLTIECDGDEFAENANLAVQRILLSLAARLQNAEDYGFGSVFDVNGNNVGEWSYEG